jgi:hypothetical protein
MLKRVHINIILLDILSLFFIIQGVKRLFIASQGEKYKAILNNDLDVFNTLTSYTMGEFVALWAYWAFGAFIIGIVGLSLINWKNKIGITNSILPFLIVFSFFPAGIFSEGFINTSLNSFGWLFGGGFSISFLIGGTVFLLIGLLLFRKSIQVKKGI